MKSRLIYRTNRGVTTKLNEENDINHELMTRRDSFESEKENSPSINSKIHERQSSNLESNKTIRRRYRSMAEDKGHQKKISNWSQSDLEFHH